MDERDKELEEQAAGSEEEIVMPPKRGRGRPKNEEPEAPTSAEAQAEEKQTDQSETTDKGKSSSEDFSPGEKQTQDYSLSAKGTQIIAELVKSQNKAQENMIRVQTEFSNQVMDRMDNYRLQMSQMQSEIAEKDKTRLRADYLSLQDKLDEYQEKVGKLMAQLDNVNRKNLKLTGRTETLTSENESLRQQVKALQDQIEALKKMEPPTPPKQTSEETVSFPKEGWLTRMRRKRFLKKIFARTDFSDQQKDIIWKADAKGIPFEMLAQICDPSIPAANMERMITYSKEG